MPTKATTCLAGLDDDHYRGKFHGMALARSKITSQGQISVPAEVRKKLGVGPGSLLQWDEEEGKVVIRRVGKFSCKDVQAALFPDGPPKPLSSADIKSSIARHLKAKHARR
jgi:AbrB family looped-hinge helix DNA binding protein